MKMVVDKGYSFTKGINDRGDKVVIPSMIGTPHSDTDDDIKGEKVDSSLNNLHISIESEIINSEYFIGELARRESPDASFSFDRRKFDQPGTLAVLATVAGMLIRDSEPLTFCTCVPFSYYKSQKAEVEEKLREFQAKVHYLSGPIQGETRFISFDQVIVLPEGIAAMYQAIEEIPRNLLKTGALLGLVDGGFRTTNLSVFEMTAEGLRIRADLCKTLNIGISQLIEMVGRKIKDTIGEEMDVTNLFEVLANPEEIWIDGEPLDFSREVNQCRDEIASAVKDRIKLAWGKAHRQIRVVTMAGGGVLQLKDRWNDLHANVQILNRPQTANADGAMRLLKRLENINAPRIQLVREEASANTL